MNKEKIIINEGDVHRDDWSKKNKIGTRAEWMRLCKAAAFNNNRYLNKAEHFYTDMNN